MPVLTKLVLVAKHMYTYTPDQVGAGHQAHANILPVPVSSGNMPVLTKLVLVAKRMHTYTPVPVSSGARPVLTKLVLPVL